LKIFGSDLTPDQARETLQELLEGDVADVLLIGSVEVGAGALETIRRQPGVIGV
jgi:uncharacterized protein (DUF697 family)